MHHESAKPHRESQTPSSAAGKPLKPTPELIEDWLLMFSVLPMAAGRLTEDLLLEIWHRAFDSENNADFQQACSRAMLECKFFPSPAEINERLSTKPKLLIEVAGEADWVAIEKLAAYFDAEAVPQFNAQTFAKLREMAPAAQYACRAVGGLGSIRAADRKATPFLKRDFMEAYKRHQEAGILGITEGNARQLLDGIQQTAKLLEAGK